MRTIKAIFILLQLLWSNVVLSQDIAQISRSNPLVITGAIGTQNTYRYSSVGNGFSSPMSNLLYANMNVSYYGVTMPVSFYYSNNSVDFNHSCVSFSISPKYRNWSGHIGLSNMDFSDYLLNKSFNGIGLEYKEKNWSGGFFYGKLQSAVNDDPTDPYSRSPQYSRLGWGLKAGYTDGKEYSVDLYMLHAYDQLSSLDDYLRKVVRPQESLVLGLKGSYYPMGWLSFTANVATSVFSTDTESGKVSTTTCFDKIFDTNYSSLMRFAGDMSMNVSLPYGCATLYYKIIQPDYNSLGTYYMSDNYQSLGLTANSFLFNKVSLSANLSRQSDNVSGEQLYTTYGYLYNLCASSRIISNLNLSAMYSGYIQNQKDGMCMVPDQQRVHRRLSSFSITPSYTFEAFSYDNCLSLSLNFSENRNLNMLSENDGDVKTVALGLCHDIDVESIGIDFTTSLSHQRSEGLNTTYRSDLAVVTASRSFLSDNSLNVSASLSVCNSNIKNELSYLSLGLDASASYIISKAHVFSASLGITSYGDSNVVPVEGFTHGTDITVSLNYIYTFGLMK